MGSKIRTSRHHLPITVGNRIRWMRDTTAMRETRSGSRWGIETYVSQDTPTVAQVQVCSSHFSFLSRKRDSPKKKVDSYSKGPRGSVSAPVFGPFYAFVQHLKIARDRSIYALSLRLITDEWEGVVTRNYSVASCKRLRRRYNMLRSPVLLP